MKVTNLSHKIKSAIQNMPMFKKIREVGSGTFGKALLVTDEKGNEFVMKIVDLSKMDDEARRTAQNEAQVLSSLGPHPYIIRYHRSYTQGTKLYIIMDFAQEGDMYQKIKSQKKTGSYFPESTILTWFAQACLAIHYLHRKHILHRDLKAQNIFLGKENQLLIGDFGIAKVLESTVAVARTVIGTPYYLSPELCKGGSYSYPADIWAMGCILYEMAALTKPFAGNSLDELVQAIKSDHIPPLPSQYSEELRTLVATLLNPNPSLRPTIAEVLQLGIVKRAVQPLVQEHQKANGLQLVEKEKD